MYIVFVLNSLGKTENKKKVRKSGSIDIIFYSSGKHVREMYTPLLYSKTGVCRGIPIFLFLLQNKDCGYSLEPPHPQSMF